MTAPLIVTADETLLDELLRLAAAAGTTPEVAHDVSAALRAWNAAPIVLVGGDRGEALARAAPPRRDGVFVVQAGQVADELFRTALSLGAECVAELPRSGGWLIERLTDVVDTGLVRGLTVGVIGGSGGAGATTFACALGQMAARHGTAMVIDTDPLGAGIDRVLGLDVVEGVRWDALCRTTGRLSARALRDSLPRRGGLGALTWYGGPQPGSLQAFAAREALSAAQRGHDTVVVDLRRSAEPLIEELASRCDHLLVVVEPSVTGLAAAVRLCARYRDSQVLRLVVRGSGIEDDALEKLVGAQVLVRMGDQRGLAESVDLGFGPVRSRRGPLGRAATSALAGLRSAGAVRSGVA